MRARGVVLGVMVGMVGVAASAPFAAAQTAQTMSPLEIAVACAPPPDFDSQPTALRIAGAQDTVRKAVFGQGDLLVLRGGGGDGVQLGQQYFVRRTLYTNGAKRVPHGAQTLGWVRIVAVNDSTAIGSIEGFCNAMSIDDYLEPFSAPVIPEAAIDTAMASQGELDFTSLGRVLGGIENHDTTSAGEFLMIDRGADQGVTPGARFAVYRDLRAGNVPLASIGDGVVIVAGKSTALARVTRSRDAIISGDYVVPRK